MKDLIKKFLLLAAMIAIVFAAAELVRRFCAKFSKNYVTVD